MKTATIWKKSLLLSFCFHLVVLPILGYVSSHLPEKNPPDEEPLLEMMLDAEGPANQPTIPNTPAMSNPSIAPKAEAAALNTNTNSPVPIKTNASTVVNEAAATMTDADLASVSVPASSNAAASSQTAAASSAGEGSSEQTAPSGGSSHPTMDDIIRPSLYAKVDPVYPPEAKQANIEGTVVLKIQILSSGRTGSISVYRSSGNSQLDQAAIDAVENWQFIPAKNGSTGQAISCNIIQPIAFQIH